MQSRIPLILIAAVIALLTLSACNSTRSGQAPSVATENTTGGYISPKNSPWYQVKGGQLYAWDGADWYVLKKPQGDAGSVGGADVGTVERWVRAGGSNVQSYCRTPATFRDATLRPVFLAY